jgi:eukaryotic-like serine/threonine-protein kinase
LYDNAFLKGDHTEMDRFAAISHSQSGTEAWIMHKQALALAHAGRLREARSRTLRAVELAREGAQPERAALWQTGAALWEAFYGNAVEARRNAMAALELSHDREVAYGAAFALALAGDSARSKALADDLEKRFPEGTALRFNYLPALRGHLALERGNPARAKKLLEIAVPYELGYPPSAVSGFFGALYPVYVRGEAYLAEHQGAEAAKEFQKIVDHPGVVMSDPMGAMARLQLARALALAKDTRAAKGAYEEFLSLWKNADPDVPVLKQAQAEYARVQ